MSLLPAALHAPHAGTEAYIFICFFFPARGTAEAGNKKKLPTRPAVYGHAEDANKTFLPSSPVLKITTAFQTALVPFLLRTTKTTTTTRVFLYTDMYTLLWVEEQGVLCNFDTPFPGGAVTCTVTEPLAVPPQMTTATLIHRSNGGAPRC